MTRGGPEQTCMGESLLLKKIYLLYWVYLNWMGSYRGRFGYLQEGFGCKSFSLEFDCVASTLTIWSVKLIYII